MKLQSINPHDQSIVGELETSTPQVVAINTANYYKPVCPIGGYKKSGIGREYGRIGMQEFTQVKLIAVSNPF